MGMALMNGCCGDLYKLGRLKFFEAFSTAITNPRFLKKEQWDLMKKEQGKKEGAWVYLSIHKLAS
jgi:hypothetical protein